MGEWFKESSENLGIMPGQLGTHGPEEPPPCEISQVLERPMGVSGVRRGQEGMVHVFQMVVTIEIHIHEIYEAKTIKLQMEIGKSTFKFRDVNKTSNN